MERYPRLQKVQRMLDVLDRALAEAEQAGKPGLMVMIRRAGPEPGISLNGTRNIDLAKELGLSGGETVGLFRWSESAGYIRPSYGSGSRDAATSIAFLEHLETEGYELIGQLPNPQERLALILEAAIQAARRDADLDPRERKPLIDWLEEVKFVLRTSGVEVAKAVLRGDLPPM
jgi:hypothetical protein